MKIKMHEIISSEKMFLDPLKLLLFFGCVSKGWVVLDNSVLWKKKKKGQIELVMNCNHE